MNLLVDIGNARIKWAMQDADGFRAGRPLARENKAFKDLARPAWKELQPPQRVIVSSVAGGEYDKSVVTWVKRRWKVQPEFLRAGAEQLGVTNAYKQPERLGADRWACLLAARAQYQTPLIVVDCGTAITVDALTAAGRHLGGLIAPGIELMSAALTQKAPGIELLQQDSGDIALLGSSTEVAVAGGTLYAAVSLVDRALLDLNAELGRATQALITGGDAERIRPLLSLQPVHKPDLVLEGLAAFADSSEKTEAPVPSAGAAPREPAVCDT